MILRNLLASIQGMLKLVILCALAGGLHIVPAGASGTADWIRAHRRQAPPPLDSLEPKPWHREDCQALVFAFFKWKPEQGRQGEMMYMAYSTDGFNFEELNQGRAVLSMEAAWRKHHELGEAKPVESIRDPYIARDRHGVYHLVATNGHLFGAEGSIIHSQSKDLVRWTVPSLHFPHSIHTDYSTKYVWAPEWRFDTISGKYMVFWSSMNDDGHFQIWAALTSDFAQYSPSEILFDASTVKVKGVYGADMGREWDAPQQIHSVIDASIIQDRVTSQWHLLVADSPFNPRDTAGTRGKRRPHRIWHLTSNSLFGPYDDMMEIRSPQQGEGPSAIYFKGRWFIYYDCTFAPHVPIAYASKGWSRAPYGVSICHGEEFLVQNFTIVDGSCGDDGLNDVAVTHFPKDASHGSFVFTTSMHTKATRELPASGYATEAQLKRLRTSCYMVVAAGAQPQHRASHEKGARSRHNSSNTAQPFHGCTPEGFALGVGNPSRTAPCQ
ncbi:hypothetical protein CYMTET_12422 [Cymbomonas tetramitiformis]|uniref:Uncharacterized protein n=1 Tax=Cymbomonas tetramitiformis TaxID=36881 RepID=A0AAE0LC61_9CHLO|nr:hypothetical protein CYMTET_12422 [Cymbomonas tetramitiformis]